MAAIVAGAAAAIYAERTTMRGGVAGLTHVRLRWVGFGFAAEFVSMVAFAQLEKHLLRVAGAAGSALSLRAVLATAYRANAISVAVPIIGSAMATGYAYREFRRRGAEPAQVSVALTLAGIFSTVAFALLAAAGAIATGNLAAAVLTAAGGAAAAVVAGAVLVSLRFPRARAWLERLAVVVLSGCRRVVRRPRTEPTVLVAGALARAGSVRLGGRAGWQALAWALVNWTADLACLACAIEAARAPVPWRLLLVIWSAGAGAASFCPVPAGIGVVDIVLITALAAAGLSAPHAVTAVLIYRLITFKIFVTIIWLSYHHLAERRHPPAPGRPRPSPPPATRPAVRGRRPP